jgi:hypothetical protein
MHNTVLQYVVDVWLIFQLYSVMFNQVTVVKFSFLTEANMKLTE